MKNDFLEVMEWGDKLELGFGQRAKKIANLKERLAAFGKFMNYTPTKRKLIIEEAETTSDFPILFGTVLERSLLAKYSIAKPDYRNYVKVGTQNDFRISGQQLIALWGLQSTMSVVKERGEYQAGNLKDGKVAIQLQKFGRQFPLSWEALINDDLGAFSDIAERLANAALRTEFYQATGLFVDANGPHASLFGTSLAHPIDAAVINNKGTDTFNADNLAKVIALMTTQLDAEGEPVVFDGFELIYGPSLNYRVLQALNPASLIVSGLKSTSSGSTQTSANVVASMNIRPHMNQYISQIDKSANNQFSWYVIGSLTNGAAVQLNMLRGHEAPEIVQKVSDKQSLGGGLVSPMEGDFDTDTMRWRVRHIMGGTQIDPRLAYANVANS